MTNSHDAVSVRPLGHADLPAALAIQSEAYPPFLLEDRHAFASRLAVAAPYCLAATLDGALIAYLLAHGWPGESPPAVGTILDPDAPREVLFIHDLAVSGGGRGSGIGRRLVAEAFALAARDGLWMAELIAVQGAAGYWRRLGFIEASTSPALARKVAGYGPEARWMHREIGSVRPRS